MKSIHRTIQECNVCVIGGAGFLGSHLVNHLIEDRQCKVTVIDNLASGHRKHVHDKAEFMWGSIEDEELIRYVLQSRFIRFVFNYAADPYIPECYERPLHFFQTNAVGALKVLNA